MARQFALGEIRPHTGAWDSARALDDSIFTKLGELGFMGMLVPEAYGGLEFDIVTYLVALEEIAWGDASVALSMAIHNGPVSDVISRHGSESQKSELLPLMASGELITAFALSEAEAGSDAASLSTRARREGDEWVIEGAKKWVTNGDRAGLVVVFARTGDGSEDNSIGAFLVDRSSQGYRVGRREKTMGLCASETVEVEFEGVRVPADRLVGDPAKGLSYAMQALDLGRLGVAAQALGIAQAALEHASGYSVEREQFGKQIAEFGAIQFKLADMTARIGAARALTREVGVGMAAGDGQGFGPDVAMAKLVATEAAMWVTDEAVQIYGGYGYMRDYPVEKLMRDAKGAEIYEGTSEIMRVVIARDVVRRARAER
jgi:alkylation response protein AidB-like acyl-CoA dehydrogenase